jgi:hypothetical protein
LLNWGQVLVARGSRHDTERGRMLLERALAAARERHGTAIQREAEGLLATLAAF